MTLLLTPDDLEHVVDREVLADEMRAALAAPAEDGLSDARLRAKPSESVTAEVLMPGLAPDIPAYTVKAVAKNPQTRPAIQGVVTLHERDTGELLAIMSSAWITAVRTGISAALATDLLAPPGPVKVGVVGAGAQGREQLRALARRREVAAVRVTDLDSHTAHELADMAADELKVPSSVEPGVAAVVRRADVLLLATWSRTPVVHLRHVRPGMHITSLGADEPGKAELSDAACSTGLLVVDDRELARPVVGEADTTLADVLRGEHPGRLHADDVTIYSQVGLPRQDLVAAWHVYGRARTLRVGTEVDLR